MINFEDFIKVELRVGTIQKAEEVEGSERLLKFEVDLGEEAPRQIIAGIKQWYKPEDLINKQVVIAANLEPKMIMGMESQGMMLAAGDTEAVLLQPFSPLPPGTKVR